MVEDEFVPAVVAVITKINRTGNFGDGNHFTGAITHTFLMDNQIDC